MHANDDPLRITTPDKNSWFYHQGDSLFGAAVVSSLQNGWTLIPQERGERRRSSIIDGRALKYGEYNEKPPTMAEAKRWAAQVPSANGAILLGKASGNTFCADIDVLDEDLAYGIIYLADDIFGRTPFSRIGQAPKHALFYRVASEADLPANRSYHFDGDDGAMLEIQSRGKLVTAYGYHHKTERYFSWEGAQPTTDHVYTVTLVTLAQVDEFIERVQELRPFSTKAGSSKIEFIEGDGRLEVSAEGWTIPRRTTGVIDPLTGLVRDSREDYLRQLCWDLVRLNPERASASPATAVEVAYAHAMKTIDRSKAIDLRAQIVDKLKRDIWKLRTGQITHLPKVRQAADGKRSTSRRGVMVAPTDPELWHLPAADRRKALDFDKRTAPDPAKAATRALISDRDDIAIDVEGGVLGALESIFDEVYSTETQRKTVHVLRVPTGGGKTTQTTKFIASDPRTFLPVDGDEDGDRSGPILFLLPTYDNIDELRSRTDLASLDPDADDATLAAQAAALGLMTVKEAEEAIEELRGGAKGSKLETMVYRGKIASGCKLSEKVQQLMDAGISTSGLCHAKDVYDKATGQREEKWCPHYSTCDAIAQRAKIARSHVVFMPHAFLNLSIPEELKNVRAVIADERIFTLTAHVARMHMSTLELARDAPPLTKQEREIATAGISETRKRERWEAIERFAVDFVQDRRLAADRAIKALRDGRCPADALAGYRQGKLDGAALAKTAARVCGAGSGANVVVHPDMEETEFADLVARPRGKEIKLEYRFWKIVEERIAQLADGTAKQSRDMRIQRIVDSTGNAHVEYVRLSWRSDLNWSSAPLLLLDASADERIIAKAFGDRHVVMHDIDAPLNMKCVMIMDSTRSTTSLKPKPDIKSSAAQQQARAVERVRQVETALATRHADGRMIVGMAKAVREARSEFAPSANIDTMHYGAERGLNFAKGHVAALAVGRMELPIWMLDAYASAFGYDDEEELILLDPRGDGLDAAGNELKPLKDDLVIPMRDGTDIVIQAAMAPAGTWQSAVQIQFREESLRQFAGRLRPVYRKDAPILYLMGRVLPKGIIVDDVVTTDDLVPNWMPLLDAARSLGGVLDPVLAYEARPDLATRERYREMMTTLPEQLRAAYAAVRYTLRGETHYAGVPAWLADPVEAMKSLLEWAELDATDITLIRQPTRTYQRPAAVRPLDAVEIAMGENRHDAERNSLVRAVDWLSVRHEKDRTQQPYVAGRSRYPVGTYKDGKAIELGLSAIAMLTRPDEKATSASSAADVDQAIAI